MRLSDMQRAGSSEEEISQLLGHFREASAQDELIGTEPNLLSSGELSAAHRMVAVPVLHQQMERKISLHLLDMQLT